VNAEFNQRKIKGNLKQDQLRGLMENLGIFWPASGMPKSTLDHFNTNVETPLSLCE
jgi:hypothetical protein